MDLVLNSQKAMQTLLRITIITDWYVEETYNFLNSRPTLYPLSYYSCIIIQVYLHEV